MVAKHRRKEMWIATKAWDRTRDGARRQLEESLKRLQTDHVDEWRMHNVWSFDDLDELLCARAASLEAMVKARDEGLVRYISISGHTDPQVQVEALRRFPFDSVLVAISVLDHFVYSFAEEFLPVANAKGVATIAMKVFALGALGHVADRALRYTLGLPASTVIVGCSKMEELEKDLAVAESFQPLTGRRAPPALPRRAPPRDAEEHALEGQRVEEPHRLDRPQGAAALAARLAAAELSPAYPPLDRSAATRRVQAASLPSSSKREAPPNICSPHEGTGEATTASIDAGKSRASRISCTLEPAGTKVPERARNSAPHAGGRPHLAA